MLKKAQVRSCIECGLPYDHPDFVHHAGRVENGPAYWSERGLLCSHGCSTAHFVKRVEAGDPMSEPAPDPLG